MTIRSRNGLLVLGLMALGLQGPAGASVQPSGTPARTAVAPLDTLITEPEAPAPDPRYAQPDVSISRRVLPQVTASQAQTGRLAKQPPRLDDPLRAAYSYRLARQAALAGNAGGVSTNMAAALESAPGHPRYQWWSLTQSVRARDTATLAKVLPTSVRTLVDSPVARGPFVIAAHQAVLLATTIFWTVLVVALWLGRWRLLAHDLSALLLKDRQHRPRLVLPLLALLLTIALRPGWLGLLALLSVPVLVRTRGRRHNLLLMTWLGALCLSFPGWPLLRSAVPTIDPSSEVTLLEQGCTMPPSASLIDALTGRLAQADEPGRQARLSAALGIQEARRGSFAASDRHFQKALALEPGAFTATVGLANNLYYLGKLDEATSAYRQAATSFPKRGEIPYNLAQLQFKKLFVPEATASLDQARRLGFDPPHANSEPNPREGFSAVVYPGLTGPQMTAACNWEGRLYAPLVALSGWRTMLGTPPVPLYMLVGAPLLLALLAVAWNSRRHDAYECDNCGAPLCRTCSGVHEDARLCAGCNETAVRSRSDLVLGTLLKNRGRSEGLAHATRIIRMGRFVPGAGHLATGCFWGGWLRLSLVAGGLFLVMAGWAFDPGAELNTPGLLLPGEMIHPLWMPLPAALWPGLSGAPVVAGLIMLGVAWLIALLDAPGLRRRLHDRFTTITGTARNQPARRAGAGAR
jgi:tetratricopeptide (TPR) repeat protein